MNILTARSLVIIFALAGGCFAQSEVGGASLNGTVTDPSGASVPNAKVGVTNAATGLARSTQTSDVGFDLTNRANFSGIQNNLYTFRSGVFTLTTNYLTKLRVLPRGVGARVFQLAAKFTF